jgi:hypothetical protein
LYDAFKLEGPLLNEHDQTNSSSTPLTEQPARPPSIGLGIISILLGIPFVAFDVAFARSRESKSLLAWVVMLVVFLFFISLPVHFFFGHRFRWILPGLMIVLGAVFTAFGIMAGNIGGVVLGGMMLLVGIAWNVPSTSTHPFMRWIANRKKYFTQDLSRKS